MRQYTVATVALALDVPVKWIDNTLSHHRVTGVLQARQGVSRRLSFNAVIVLETTLRLIRSLELPTAAALRIAHELVHTEHACALVGACEVRMDIGDIREAVAARLANAVEISPVPRRGRPPRGR